ncbi:amidase family protein [Methylobacterium gnaphalii]|uniref:Amidase n=1 Tax=Methylobacterium gnaphalii TaxID=1010610 RepID=A0A512JPJ5_9HYPH|nr:amidase family protein [Methylobacterium gnaphalii]GEP11867.1 amidase [Methylobacterium gnaphalii]GJD71490.1 Glutamyl-tRNA(Gln) amidotransferase subunit A [Methylobacterium gnaphalii]GLS47698.1 amidase [Methylobacterium gnaphalii]
MSVSIKQSLVIGVVALPYLGGPAWAEPRFTVEEASIASVHAALRDGSLTCRGLVQSYLGRIAAYDTKGPALAAIRAVDEDALAQADAVDRDHGRLAEPLACVPVVLKDNYNTAELPTTGGSASLTGARPAKDAFVVARLRKAGAIILAKANMQEFALGGVSVSSIGGQVRNPYDPSRTPGGSSGGTGAAVAANFALAGTGSDTVNSIRSPASANNLVGLRATQGLISLNGIMPVSKTQDAVGPITRSVADAAALLQAMAGTDPDDPASAAASGKAAKDYAAFLKPDALKGARLGVVKPLFGTKPEHEEVNRVMKGALATLEKAGATLVDIDDPAFEADRLNAEDDVQTYEFKTLFNAYLAAIPNAPQKDLAGIIASGQFHKAALEKFITGAEARRDGLQEPEYKARLERIAAFRAHVAEVFDKERLDALVYPLQKRLVVPIGELNQSDRNGIIAGLTGYPALDLPAGFSAPTEQAPLGVPVGLDLLGRPWEDGKLLGLGFAFEQASQQRRAPLSTPPLADTKPR